MNIKILQIKRTFNETRKKVVSVHESIYLQKDELFVFMQNMQYFVFNMVH